MKKTAIILSWLLICSMVVFGQNTSVASENQAELLRQLNVAKDGTARIKLLHKIALITREDDNQALYYIDLLEKESKSLNNDKYLSTAYIMRMAVAYNSFDIETINKYMALLEPLAKKNKFYDDLFKGRRCVLDMLVLTGDHEKSEREAKRMLKEAEELNSVSGIIQAYQSLATTYRMTYRAQKAIGFLNKAYDLALSINNYSAASEIMETLIMTYEDIGDLQHHLEAITTYEKLTKRIEAEKLENKTFTNISFFSIYLSYATYYMLVNNNVEAENYLDMARKYYSDKLSPIYRGNYHIIGFSYYNNTKQYEKSLTEINAAIKVLRELGALYDYYKSVFSKAGILYSMERYDDALVEYKKHLSLKDSLQISTINKQHGQLKQYFNEDQLLLEKAQIQHRMLLSTILFLGLILATIIYMIIHASRSGKLLKKHEQEIYGAASEVEAANAAKDSFLSNINMAIRKPLNEVVEGSIRLAGESLMTKDESQALSTLIQTKSASLMQLINNILDLSRLEAGMMKFMYADNELLTIIGSAVSAAEASIGGHIEVKMPQNELYMINTDGGRLQQVFQSLLSNRSGEKPICVKVEYVVDIVHIIVYGSALSEPNPSQETVIHNEINRMLLEEFGGCYVIKSSNEVEITIKPTQIIKAE